MLTTELPKFQQEIHNILHKSASDAFMQTLDVTGSLSINSEFNKIMKETADKFGLEFANKAAPDLAKSIMQYIQSASLSIVVQPQGLATILTAAGPCSGTLLINDGTATINIL